ncbi:DUF3105 domain-containing protein [Pseudonocardia petroleophila]|uniref:DUF3105 domain-containing protein n=2 Tax=Pseudonocardia petroleophila TaxID=37331 RepID=A0A7G7MS30_9PSEU|nr:DUF3105 domain-containing protein [Pseudonocardia petroleophila]
MVSGKNSKAVRNARAAVVTRRSTPWGLIAGVVAVVVFAGAVFGYAFVQNQANAERLSALAPFTPTAENPDPSTQIEGVQVVEYTGGQHVDPVTQVAYTNSPPFGGAHDAVWAACNGVVYDQPVRSENLVHSLEHGAVWITYDPEQVSGAALDTLRAKVDGQSYMVMSPYPGMDSPFSLQSWGHQLKLTDVNDPRIDQFVTALRVNRNTHPEPGASCEEVGPGGFVRTDPPPFAAPPAPGTPGSQPETAAGTDAVTPDAGS